LQNGTQLGSFKNDTSRGVCCSPGWEQLSYCYAACWANTSPSLAFARCYK
jgi:hypothetical protein